MKQKLLMMLAALMLMGTSAMAQNETLKGDVNADGAVDVADIAAEVKIMTQNAKDNGGTEYYWYIGAMTEEQALNPEVLASIVDKQNPTYIAQGPATIKLPKQGGEVIVFVYPKAWGTPVITFKGYGTGDGHFEEDGFPTPEGYGVVYWDGDKTDYVFDVTWKK